jgi:hypothetical protein
MTAIHRACLTRLLQRGLRADFSARTNGTAAERRPGTGAASGIPASPLPAAIARSFRGAQGRRPLRGLTACGLWRTTGDLALRRLSVTWQAPAE